MRHACETNNMLFMVNWSHVDAPTDPTTFGRFVLTVEIEDGNCKKSVEFHTSACVTDMAQIVWEAVMQGKLPDLEEMEMKEVNYAGESTFLPPENVEAKHSLLIIKAGPDKPVSAGILKGDSRVPVWANEGNRLDVLLESLHEFNNYI